MYNIAAIALLAGGGSEALGSGGNDLRRAPIMKNKVPIPIAEMNNESLRPKDSTAKKMKKTVAMIFTTP